MDRFDTCPNVDYSVLLLWLQLCFSQDQAPRNTAEMSSLPGANGLVRSS